MEHYMKQYEFWQNDPFFSPETRAELAEIAHDENEIKERFYQYLTFGTGGLRGVIGAGTNRMNNYTVALASEGFARYIDSLGEEGKKAGVCISYDSRLYSPEFAEITALVFAQHGIKARLFSSLHPTPMLSYAVRYYKASGGVMITASHNPGKYNGYKAYGADGGQLPPAAADIVLREMNAIEDIRAVKVMDKAAALEQGLLEYIPETLDNDYYAMLKTLSICPDLVAKHADMKIVYTPLNGAGNVPVRRILRELGCQQVLVVPEQELPDPAFTTCSYPNPEDRAALELAIQLAQKEKADLVIATDPDSDRMGLCVREKNGEYTVLTGNQIGTLLLEYILSAKAARNCLPDRSFAVTTIVSTRLVHKIAAHFGVKMYEVLTGFKYVGELIKNLDENGPDYYQFGFEESFGYLAGTSVRDKDAVVASMLITELAALCREEGMTVSERLQKIYEKYGYAEENTVSLTLEGLAGIAKIEKALQSLREKKVNEIASFKVKAIRDYRLGEKTVFHDDGKITVEKLTLPSSNVLLYEFEGDDWACVRPSGTEPKLKVYCGCYGASKEEVHERLLLRGEGILTAIKSLI